MKHYLSVAAVATLSTSSFAVGCAAPADDADEASVAALSAGAVGAVFTMTNAASGNELLAFPRMRDGSLGAAIHYPTTGKGSGDSLGSQGAVTLSADHRWLFVVDAGDAQLSVFSVRGAALRLIEHVSTGGPKPVSVTVHGSSVYVLNGGEPSSVTGFVQRSDGTLAPLPGSMQTLGTGVGPAQVSFSPDGRELVVTEKAANAIARLDVDRYTGVASGAMTQASAGMTPYGFAFTRRSQLVVSEAFGGADAASALSSYQLGAAGLVNVSASIKDHQSAACWVVLARNDSLAFTSNTKSGSISAYHVGEDGGLSLLSADGRSGVTGVGTMPTDMATSVDDRFLYAVDSGAAKLSILGVRMDGSLVNVGDVDGLPATITGLAAE